MTAQAGLGGSSGISSPRRRFGRTLSITFAFVATHNHFVLDRGGKVFNSRRR